MTPNLKSLKISLVYMSPFSCFTLISKPKTNSKTPTVVLFMNPLTNNVSKLFNAAVVVLFMKPLTNYVAKLFNATVDWHLNLFVFFASDVKWLRSSPGSVTSSSHNMRSVGCQNILISTSVSSSLLYLTRKHFDSDFNLISSRFTTLLAVHHLKTCSEL